jgi:hypothetical protein
VTTSADPVGLRGTIQIDPCTSVNFRLSIKRTVVCVLRDQHLAQEPWPSKSALDRSRWRRSFYDHIAFRAAQLRAYVTDHLEAGRSMRAEANYPMHALRSE